MKCRGGNVILRGIFQVASCFPLHSMLYRKNLDCFSYRVRVMGGSLNNIHIDNVSLIESSLSMTKST